MDPVSSTSQDLSRPSEHDPHVSTSSKAAYPRQRAIRACKLCRTRRFKCDCKRPKCSACEKAGAECIQTHGDNAVALDPASLKILQRIDDLEGILRSLQLPGASFSSIETASPNEQPHRFRVTTEELLSWKVF